MVFSTRAKKSSPKTTNLYEPFPRSASATALGSPKRPNKQIEGQWTITLAAKGPGGSPATPGYDSQGSFADLGSPGSAARPRPGQWQPRDRPPNWEFQSGDRRRSEAVKIHADAGTPGIKRIPTSDEEHGPGAARGSISDLRKQVDSRPTFQASHGSPGLESVSTNTGGDPLSTSTGGNLLSANTGGNPWSKGRYGALRRYSVGGTTQVFKDEDLPGADRSAVRRPRGREEGPQAWTFSEKMRTWEKRLYGDVSIEDRDELHRDERQKQQALDASLSESFGQFNRSPRDEGIASHPAQRGMRAAFTDRSLKQAHLAGHWSLGHEAVPVAEGSERTPSVGGISPASFNMPAAGEGVTSRGRRRPLDTMHMEPVGDGPPGNSVRYARSSSRDSVGYHLRRSPREPERDSAQVQREEGLLRSQFGTRRPGEMAPPPRRRAHSEEPWAGNLRKRGSKLELFKDESPREGGGARHTEKRQVPNWLPNDRDTVSKCLSARDGAAAKPEDIIFVHGLSPPTTRFDSTRINPQGDGRPNTRSYSLGRRRGRGDDVAYSAEAKKHSVMRDSESVAMYRYERIASGQDRPRACSQPPVYNPLTHEGELYPNLESTRSQSRGKRIAPCAASQKNSSRSAGRALDFQACKEEEEELRRNRLCNERAFSELCSATVMENKQRSEECSKILGNNHHQRSSNMAQLLTWE